MVRKKTILIIDDQKSTRMLLTHYLGHQYNVVEKAGAKEALEYLNAQNGADIIISDILMPDMNGVEFLDAYKQQTKSKSSPVIVLSSVENSTERLKCFKHGASDFITKPFNPEELQVRISNVLTHKMN